MTVDSTKINNYPSFKRQNPFSRPITISEKKSGRNCISINLDGSSTVGLINQQTDIYNRWGCLKQISYWLELYVCVPLIIITLMYASPAKNLSLQIITEKSENALHYSPPIRVMTHDELLNATDVWVFNKRVCSAYNGHAFIVPIYKVKNTGFREMGKYPYVEVAYLIIETITVYFQPQLITSIPIRNRLGNSKIICCPFEKRP